MPRGTSMKRRFSIEEPAAPTIHDLAPVVDRLGTVKAQISDLTKVESELKQKLIDSGYKEVDGKLFRATVSNTTKETLVPKLVKMALTAAKYKACLRTTKSTVVRVNSRIRQT